MKKWKKTAKRILVLLLTVALIGNTVDFPVFAASGSENQTENIGDEQEPLDETNAPALVDEPLEGAVAKVEKDGAVIAYLDQSNFKNAFTEENSNATVTLLDDVTTTDKFNIPYETAFTLDLAGHTISTTSVSFSVSGSLTIRDSGKTGKIISTGSNGVVVGGGTVTLEGGTFACADPARYAGVKTMGDGCTVNVTGADVYIDCLDFIVALEFQASLSAGTYGIIWASDKKLADRLAKDGHYAYFDADGNPVPLTDLQDKEELTGPITVEECMHQQDEIVSDNNGTHTLTCPYCNYVRTEDCTYGDKYDYDETNHWQTCTLCGYGNKEVHTIKPAAHVTDNVITVSERCETCGYGDGTTLGTVTLHIPEELTYKATKDKAVTWETSLPLLDNMLGIRMDNEAEKLCEESYSLPELTAGEHTLEITVDISEDIGNPKYATCIVPLIVAPASLAEGMVELSGGPYTYDRTEHKPAVTVGDLAEGTDYEVAYSTADFTNAGTYMVTVTGKGNYAGKVEKTYTVAKAVPYITESPKAAQIIYGDTLDISVLTGGKVQHSDSDVNEVPGSFTWKDGDLKPVVSDSGSTMYTVVFNPSDSTNYSSVETKITLTVEQAENAPNMPADTMNVANGCKKISDVQLPSGWQWQDIDKDTPLEIGIPVTATAVYTVADKDNYKNVTVIVSIIRAECEHDYVSKVTTEPTTDKEGTRTYTCTRCGKQYKESIPKLPDDTEKTVSLEPVKIKGMVSGTKKQLTVSWSQIEGADGYEVTYASNKSFTKNKVTKKTAKTSLTLKKLDEKKTWYVKVRAYAKKGTKTYTGTYSAARYIKLSQRPANVKRVKVKVGTKKLSVTAGTVKGATGYEIMVSTDKAGKKTVASKKAAKGKASFTKLGKKKTYYVTVRAYKKTKNGGYLYSAKKVTKVKTK